MKTRTLSGNGTSRCCHFSIMPSHYAGKMRFRCLRMKLASAIWRLGQRIENLSSSARVVHITAKKKAKKTTTNKQTKAGNFTLLIGRKRPGNVQNTKIARAKRVKLVLFILKYANL